MGEDPASQNDFFGIVIHEMPSPTQENPKPLPLLRESFMNTFNDFYYSFSPHVADYERENPIFKEMVKITITPMISSLSILNHVEMSSDLEVLGY